MKVKLFEAKAAAEAVESIKTQKLPALKSYALLSLSEAVSGEAEKIVKINNDLIKKYSSDGKKVDQDKMQAFFEELNEVMSKEVEVNFDPLPSDFFDLMELSIQDLARLKPFISK